jgi:hypothetical protein
MFSVTSAGSNLAPKAKWMSAISLETDMVALKHAQKPLKHVVCQDYLLSLLLKLQG